MKRTVVVAIGCCMFSLIAGGYANTILFSDSYDRANNLDIDASSAGMSGTLSPVTYVEIGDDTIYPVSSGTGNTYPQLTQILNNRLYMAYGTNMSTMYLNHNFIDSAIQTADGMRIGMTIVQDLGPLTGVQAFIGFGVGNTLQQCQTTWFDHNGTGFRGQLNTTPVRAGTSDFWLGWSPGNSGSIEVFKNGPTAAGGQNYDVLTNMGALTGSDRLELELFFNDFADSSTVNANIFWNGIMVGRDSFAWDADGLLENYIGINARQTVGWVADDLMIEAIYEYRANNPSPADGAQLVNASGLALSWNKGKDGSGNPNAAIGKHYLYVAPNEPNFVGLTPITVNTAADRVSSSAYSFANDTIYYWRVDESINGSSASDPNTITGYVWSFNTYTFPVINVNPGQVVTALAGTAELTCDFTSVTPPTVKWFKSGIPAVEITAGGDVAISVTNTSGDQYTTKLTINNIEAADEGTYYCQIANASGSVNAVTSATGAVGIKRQVAHWTLDETDLVGNQYLDISGNGHHAEPNIVPGSASFIDGVDPTETGDALDLTVQRLAAADSGQWAPSLYTGEITVSAWLNWTGTNSSWQGVVSNRVGAPPAVHNFYLEIRLDNGNLQLGGIAGAGDIAIGLLPINEWIHLAVTVKAGEVVVYINGEPVVTNTAGQAVTQNLAPLYIGALGRNATTGTLLNPFNGKMDDIQLYNYAFSGPQVVGLYYDVLETSACLNPSGVNLSFDVAGGGTLGDEPDCRISLPDFAAFAADWLNCGLVPDSGCN